MEAHTMGTIREFSGSSHSPRISPKCVSLNLSWGFMFLPTWRVLYEPLQIDVLA